MSVTVADVVMSDGKRLEKVGVVPDVSVIPTQHALAKGLDPVLALTATTMGYPMTPEAAGELHFIKDRSQTKVEDESDDSKEP
jgi:C-terminal processing protease CtpA/Prc